MLFLVMLLTACQPDPQAVSAEILASPEFQAAVDAAVAKKMAESAKSGENSDDVTLLKQWAGCMSSIRISRSKVEWWGRSLEKAFKKCAVPGLGNEEPGK